MTDFPTSTEAPTKSSVQDKRSLIQKMFFDHNEDTGEMTPLTVVTMGGDEDWKRVQDCIPLLQGFKKTDEEYDGPLKGKDVLIFGGRRRGRAGTGVELLLPVDSVAEFCSLVQEVAKAAKK